MCLESSRFGAPCAARARVRPCVVRLLWLPLRQQARHLVSMTTTWPSCVPAARRLVAGWQLNDVSSVVWLCIAVLRRAHTHRMTRYGETRVASLMPVNALRPACAYRQQRTVPFEVPITISSRDSHAQHCTQQHGRSGWPQTPVLRACRDARWVSRTFPAWPGPTRYPTTRRVPSCPATCSRADLDCGRSCGRSAREACPRCAADAHHEMPVMVFS